MKFHVDSVDSLAQGEGIGIERGGGQSLETDRAVSGRNFRQTLEFESLFIRPGKTGYTCRTYQ